MSSKLFGRTDLYSSSPHWNSDLLLRLFRTAGSVNEIDDKVLPEKKIRDEVHCSLYSFFFAYCSFQNCSPSFNKGFGVLAQQEASTAPQAAGASGEAVYTWVGTNWGGCSVQCGGGAQTRNVSCQNSKGGVVSETLCSQPKPATSQACQTQACTSYFWVQSGFGPCSKSCGGGTQTQTVTCSNDKGQSVSESQCSDVKPPLTRTCNTQSCSSNSNKALPLISVLETQSAQCGKWSQGCQAFANDGFYSLYENTVQVRAGDILRVRAQTEMSNDNDPSTKVVLRQHAMLMANGVQIGNVAHQNTTLLQHHVPLFTEGTYHASSDGSVVVQAMVAVSGVSGFGLKAEEGIGTLIIEHYGTRSNENLYGLRQFSTNSPSLLNSFVGIESPYTYQASVTARLNSIASDSLVLAQAQWAAYWIQGANSLGQDMHGQFLERSSVRISPFATENVTQNAFYTPLLSFGVDRSPLVNSDYTLKHYGVNGKGIGLVEAGYGYLHAIEFARLNQNANLQGLASSTVSYGPGDVNFTANSTWTGTNSSAFIANKEDVMKIVGYQAITLKSAVNGEFVACYSRIRVLDNLGSQIVTSENSVKGMDQNIEIIPLQNELIFKIQKDGYYNVYLDSMCASPSKQSSVQSISNGNSGLILIDRYAGFTD